MHKPSVVEFLCDYLAVVDREVVHHNDRLLPLSFLELSDELCESLSCVRLIQEFSIEESSLFA